MTKQKVILTKWRGRITRAIERGAFTSTDMRLSLNWAKCAIGERDCLCEKVIPNHPTYTTDSWLTTSEYEENNARSAVVSNRIFSKVATLGLRFYTAVTNNKPKKALEILKTIERLPKEKFYK